eukprot:scaffold9514_cov106-Cylindrotheca_fusiformis.AAC.2
MILSDYGSHFAVEGVRHLPIIDVLIVQSFHLETSVLAISETCVGATNEQYGQMIMKKIDRDKNLNCWP